MQYLNTPGNNKELILIGSLCGSKIQRLTDLSEVRWEICVRERPPEFWFVITIPEASMYRCYVPIYLVHKSLLLVASVATEEGTRFALRTTMLDIREIF